MNGKIGGRALKKRLEQLLLREPWDEACRELSRFPAKQSINGLVSFLCSLNPLLKWRAVSAAGTVVASLAERRPEEARVIMRRLMWMLNDESGGIGWGAPEALGEIMAQSPLLSGEYNRIIVSYLDEDGNYLEHEPLQTGLLWAVQRLARVYPDRVDRAAVLARPHLSSPDPEKRGLACLIAGYLRDVGAKDTLNALTADTAAVALYAKGYMEERSVGELAQRSLDIIHGHAQGVS